MRVSIVIPAFNEAASIAPSLQAALAQDHPDFEVIVVNNASTDGTAAVAAEFAVRVVDEPRKGLLWARECGRRHASGDIIANLDADCLPGPGWLRTGAAFLDDARVAGATGPYDYHDGGALFRQGSLLTQMSAYWLVNRVLQLPGIRKGAVLIGGNNFIRASALERVGGYNTAILFYGEDTDTAKRVATCGRVIFSNRLVMKTSARRFRTEGNLRLTARYLVYFFRTILQNGKRQTPPGDFLPPPGAARPGKR